MLPTLVTIWRIETKDGKGPWRQVPEQKHTRHWTSRDHPAPWGDTGIMRDIANEEVCGCATKRQLDNWWPQDVRDAMGDDYRLCMYIVPSNQVVIGAYQAVFFKSAATLEAVFPANYQLPSEVK
jgi:hypothetical protein